MKQVALGRDPLTDLMNRRYVVDEVERHVKRYKRHHRPFSLLVVAVHNLVSVDSTYGEAVGYSALGDLADLISANVREVDVWFLCTRDQFVIVMDETDASAAQTVAQRLAAAVEDIKFTPHRVALEMSFSTASCPDDGVEATALLRATEFPLEGARETA